MKERGDERGRNVDNGGGERLWGLVGSRELVGRRKKCFVQPKIKGGEMTKKKKNNKGRHDFLRRSCLV